MHTSKGFTLVELAVALMVIGLLVGGVLIGQEMIFNAKVAQVARNFKAYETAAVTFHEMYDDLPGMISNPGSRLPNCTTSPCNAESSQNGRYDYNLESGNFWRHMILAKLLKINETDVVDPYLVMKNEFTPYIVISYVSPGNPFASPSITDALNRFIVTDNLYGAYAHSNLITIRALDHKMDDGRPLTGFIIRNYGRHPEDNTIACVDLVNNEYPTNGGGRCSFLIEARGTN